MKKKNSLFDEQKATQVATFFIRKEGGAIELLKLMKLMYLAERLSFQKYGLPLTGDRLVSLNNGPLLSTSYDLAKDANANCNNYWRRWVCPRSKENNYILLQDGISTSLLDDLGSLSDSDIEILNLVWAMHGEKTSSQLVTFTHQNCPEWEHPLGSSKEIPYEKLFNALNFSHEDTRALLLQIEEQRELNSMFA